MLEQCFGYKESSSHGATEMTGNGKSCNMLMHEELFTTSLRMNISNCVVMIYLDTGVKIYIFFVLQKKRA